MADVLIKGMEMPTSCAVCPFENYGDCYGGKVKAIMDIDDYVSVGKRHPRCPLISVPPHGRLIDADAVSNRLRKLMHPSDMANNQWFINTLREMPTIIPASEEAQE